MKFITIKDMKSNLESYTQEIYQGESFAVSTNGMSPTVNGRVIVTGERAITRYSKEQDYLKRYKAIITNTIQYVTASHFECRDFPFIKQCLEVIDLLITLELQAPFGSGSPYFFKPVPERDEFYPLRELLATLGIKERSVAIALSKLDMPEDELRSMVGPISPETFELFQAFIDFEKWFSASRFTANPITTLEFAMDGITAWCETHITKARMHLVYDDVTWRYEPIAKGSWRYMPNKGEEEYM